jgi:hypothetical protein
MYQYWVVQFMVSNELELSVKMGSFILRITPITKPAKPIYYWAVVMRGVDED